MLSTNLLQRRHIGALAALFAVACTDAPTSTTLTPTDAPPLVAVANKPPIDQTLEGEVWICKDGTGPATNFSFAVSVDGGAATNHSVALGNCVQVLTFPTTFFNVHTVSVTETVPANWTLNSIVIESNASTATTQPVISPPNARARASHDFGLVFTFTNTFRPPLACTRTQGYWKTHPEDWDQAGDNKPFLTTSTFYNSGTSYLNILLTPPAKGNAYLILAHQFIAASLNLNGANSGIAAVQSALAGAAAYFAGAPAGIPNPGNPPRAQLLSWATTLDNFNNGIIGPGHCTD